MTRAFTAQVHQGWRKDTVSKVKSNSPSDLHKSTSLPTLDQRRTQDSASHVDQTPSLSLTKESGSKFSGASTSVAQQDQRKRNLQKVTSAELNGGASPPGDLHEATVLPKLECRRIQESAHGVDKEKERLTEKARQREDMLLSSKEAAKNWPNTIAAQRQKKLEDREIREERKEEERRKIDIEEAEFQAQKRKEAIQRAKTLQFFQTERVKKCHSALMMAEVLKEREAQIELKKRKEKAAKQVVIERIKARKAEDIIFLQKQAFKVQKRKEAAKMLQDIHLIQMAQKREQEQHIKKQEKEFEATNARLIVQDDKQFVSYTEQIIQKAREAQRNTSLLCKAAKKGMTGESGLAFKGFRPKCPVLSGFRLPTYAYDSSKAVKELVEVTDIHDSKGQLGFYWEL